MIFARIIVTALLGLLMSACQSVESVSTQPEMITVVAAGDVEWSRNQSSGETGSIFLDPGLVKHAEGGWKPIPRLLISETMTLLEDYPEVLERQKQLTKMKAENEYGVSVEVLNNSFYGMKRHDQSFASDLEWATHPFQKLRDVFRSADIAFVNLETPLSDDAPKVGSFLAPTILAKGLSDAGIDIVSVANNHMLDAQIWGLYDTLESLNKAGLSPVGGGKNITQARKPYIVEKHGIKVAFLAYSQQENNGPKSFATPSRAGIAPLDPLLIKADIQRVRAQVDHVVLSFHWDNYAHDKTKKFDLHPDAVAFAHRMIDAGADAILGHHPHVPRAVEYYKGKPILYSMGHLIFSFSLPSFVDNFVARLNITKDAITSVEILPVAGKHEELSQPYVLEGARANHMLTQLQTLSKGMGGTLRIEGNKGILTAN